MKLCFFRRYLSFWGATFLFWVLLCFVECFYMPSDGPGPQARLWAAEARQSKADCKARPTQPSQGKVSQTAEPNQRFFDIFSDLLTKMMDLKDLTLLLQGGRELNVSLEPTWGGKRRGRENKGIPDAW